MRDARHISSREVSQGVQRDVLAWMTWLGSTVRQHSGAVPLVFERLTARSCPADHGQSQSRTAATVMVPCEAQARLSYLAATARKSLNLLIVRSTSLVRSQIVLSKPAGRPPLLPRRLRLARWSFGSGWCA